MSEPEIARRCHACGASIRDHALFCPQCGKELKITAGLKNSGPNDDQSTAVDTAPLQEALEKQPEQRRSANAPPKRPRVATPKAPAPRVPGPSQKTPASLASPAGETPDQGSRAGNTPDGKPGSHLLADARHQVNRATGLARNVGGDVVQRGQKLREMSSVVLDEASYDPSLRFVLVAAVLFLLFLVMVLLNRFIG